jgi:4-amino-4-deoxy-L-arabinose transferase-like glycosyltransferase
MAVLGTITIALVAYVGRRLGGPAVGLVAAALAAVYPNVWINDGMLMAETPFVFGIVVMLLCGYRLIQRETGSRTSGDPPGRLWPDVLGLSAGVTLAALTRPEAVLLFPFLVLPMVLARRSLPWSRRFLLLGLAALVPIACFGPWLFYNRSRFEAPVAISTGAGQTLVVANCDLTYGGRNLGYWDRKCLFPPQMVTPTEPDLSLRDGIYQRRARQYIEDHLSEVPKVVVARIGRMWGVFRTDESIVDDGYIEGRAGGKPGTGFGLVREALWSYFVLLALAVPGVILLHRRRVAIYPLLAAPLLATFVAAITFGITRYRAGAEISIVLAAAVTLVTVARALFVERQPDPGPAPDDLDAAAADGAAEDTGDAVEGDAAEDAEGVPVPS